ncbi:MAG: hypothetical protein ACI9NQ_002173, partial [Paracoccaceae bacterium]
RAGLDKKHARLFTLLRVVQKTQLYPERQPN